MNQLKTSVANRLDKMVWAANVVKRASNWQSIGAQTVMAWIGRQDGVFTVESRVGVRLQAPRNDAARAPLVEVATQDQYRLDGWTCGTTISLVIDIGAHVGAFTCVAAQHFPAAQFVCVEPSATSVQWLRRNIQGNGLAGRTTVLEAAVADEDGYVTFWETGDVSSLSSLDAIPGAKERRTRSISFKSIFSGAGEQHQGAMCRVAVKMDCEGGEYAVILRGETECWSRVDYLFLEYHPSRQGTFNDLVAALRGYGLILGWNSPARNTAELGMAYFSRETSPGGAEASGAE